MNKYGRIHSLYKKYTAGQAKNASHAEDVVVGALQLADAVRESLVLQSVDQFHLRSVRYPFSVPEFKKKKKQY
jgi:hypothetical protein